MALFADPAVAAAALAAQWAGALEAYLPAEARTPEAFEQKLRAAEAEAERQLRVSFGPVVVLPEEAADAEIQALEAAGTRYRLEAAYDFEPAFWQGDRWGFIDLKQSPVISVEAIRFAYPDPLGSVFDVPIEWVRLDRKYGHVRLVPAAKQFTAPLSAFVMQALGAGRLVPFMVQVRYTAGIADAATDFPDLVDMVKKMAVLSLLQSAFLPSSGSISADGLSQSLGVDVKGWHDGIDRKMSELRDAIHGVRMTALGVA